ncbi:MAG: hypothetical protein AB7H90_23980 [Alphaproteobacteria bacterium]
MSILDIEFEWPVASCGYVVREVQPVPQERTQRPSEYRQVGFLQVPVIPPPSLLNEQSGGLFIVPRCAEADFCTKRPLALNPSLYLQFARLNDDPKAFADFATSWGYLFGWSYNQKEGESVFRWREERRLLRQALEWAERDPRNLLHFAAIEPESGGQRIAPRLSATLTWTGKLSLRFRLASLVGALWLQFMQVVTQGGEIKSCDQCGT